MRSGQFLASDDDDSKLKGGNKCIHTETSFADINQYVEKSVIDMFGDGDGQEGNKSDLHFLEPLKDFNLLFMRVQEAFWALKYQRLRMDWLQYTAAN